MLNFFMERYCYTGFNQNVYKEKIIICLFCSLWVQETLQRAQNSLQNPSIFLQGYTSFIRFSMDWQPPTCTTLHVLQTPLMSHNWRRRWPGSYVNHAVWGCRSGCLCVYLLCVERWCNHFISLNCCTVSSITIAVLDESIQHFQDILLSVI